MSKSKLRNYIRDFQTSKSLPLYKLTLFGDDGVGKFTLTSLCLFQHSFNLRRPEIKDHFRQKIDIDGQPALVDVRIVKSSEYMELSRMRKSYFFIREDDGFLLVFSVTNKQSFENIKEYHRDILDFKKVSAYPMMLVATKVDLEDLRVVSQKEEKALSAQLNIPYVETSEVESFNMDFAFHELIRIIRDSKSGTTNCRVA